MQPARLRASSTRPRALLAAALAQLAALALAAMPTERHRADGVRISYDPYASGVAEKYGHAGETDPEGFDPYADTVGPGIYGGKVRRDPAGSVVMGEQYQSHNARPGPVYAGGGYAEVVDALHQGGGALSALLDRDPSLVTDVTTGGATPLHMCGMGRDAPESVELLISRGADVDALDTYGYTALHRMASNNLPLGAAALLRGGADAGRRTDGGETPLSVAQDSHAWDVGRVLEAHLAGQ